ncbi:MAG: glutathione transport system permease protein [Frankiales bacterium]|jgi:ABC-type dipeptide/oligopeptide/nickel transport system permease subunit|nr:glutathione transport system permease protein [Frankiales bacterium]
MSERSDLLHDTSSSGQTVVLGGGPAGPGRGDREFEVAERSQWRMARRRFFRHRLAALSLFVFILLALVAFVTPYFWKWKYNSDPSFDFSVSPSWSHPFGTDDTGNDMFAFVLRGTQQSLKIALFIALFSTGVGAVYGAVSGFYKGWTDSLLMRFADVVLTLPIYVVAAVLGANVGGGTWWLIGLIVGGLLWAYVARVVRGTVLSLREKDYVEAARALGASDWRIISRHLLPNAMGVIIVNATVLMATGILTETALSFIGFGVQPPDTSLGLLVNQGQTAVFTRPWLFWIPGIFIIVIVLTVNFIGDGLRDAFDPQQTRVRS